MMLKCIAGLALAALFLAAPLHAEERATLGYGRFFNNDYIGDHDDRWRTGSYALSVLRGTGWNGALPSRAFDLREYRFGAAIIAPSTLKVPPPVDRRYSGTLSFLAQTYLQRGAIEMRFGAGLTAVGPGTSVGAVHKQLHYWLSAPRPRVLADQLPNALYPVLTAEFGAPLQIGGAELRPFVEARAGDEDWLRAGVDLAFGSRETGALWLRDETTGQRYVGIAGQSRPGFSFVLGADLARVWRSAWLPEADGIAPEPLRQRLRAGVTWQGKNFALFYGVTWLSEEFEGQPEGQAVGSLRARFNF